MADSLTQGREVPLAAAHGKRSWPLAFLGVGDWFETRLGVFDPSAEWRLEASLRGTVNAWCQAHRPGWAVVVERVGEGAPITGWEGEASRTVIFRVRRVR
jgi:hypothetical protein